MKPTPRLQGRIRSLVSVVAAVAVLAGLTFHSLGPVYASPPVNCFASPGSCGYPDPAAHNVGVTDCSALPNFSFSSIPSGTYYSGSGNLLEIVSNNVTISNLNMGDVEIYLDDVSNFTLNNVCLNVNGAGDEGSSAINVSGPSSNATIENSNVSGINDTTEALGMGVLNNGSNTLIKNNYIFNVGSGAPGAGGGSADVEDNYELVNAVPLGEHDENIYFSDNTLTINHNVLFNEEDQTAAIFGNTNGGSGGACDNHLTVTNNIMAGGDYVMYPCGNATSVGTSTSDIENNAFARCDGGTNISLPGDASACPSGADTHGYFPFGGTFGIAAYYFSGTGQIWCGNHWDDTGAYIESDGSAGSSCTPDPGGGGNGTGGSSGSSNGATTPKTPDTGLALVSAHPLPAFIVSTAAAAALIVIARQLRAPSRN